MPPGFHSDKIIVSLESTFKPRGEATGRCWAWDKASRQPAGAGHGTEPADNRQVPGRRRVRDGARQASHLQESRRRVARPGGAHTCTEMQQFPNGQMGMGGPPVMGGPPQQQGMTIILA